MSLFSKIGRVVKRVARNKIVQGALRTGLKIGTGGASEAAIALARRAQHIGKQLGAKQKGGRMLREQGVALNVATQKLAAMPAPKVTNAGSEKTEEWNVPADQADASDPYGKVPRSRPAAGGRRRKAKKASTPKKKGKPMSEETKKALRARPKKAKTSKRSGKLRSGMLDLAAMAKARKESTSNMSWPEWIKKNPIYVK